MSVTRNLAFDPDLESAFAVGQRNAGEQPRRIATVHFGGDLIDHGGLALDQTGPHAFVLRPRGHVGFVAARLAFGGEQAFQNLLWSADPGHTGEDGSDGRHALLVGLLAFGQAEGGLRGNRLDDRNAFAVDGRDENRAGGHIGRTLLVEGGEVLGHVRQHLFQAAFGNGDTREFGDGLHGRQERVLHGGLDQPAL
jgi:hypothetical protein